MKQYRGIRPHQLALDLDAEAMLLGASKAHEGSDDIYWLQQCAAVVSLLAFGKQSSLFKKYEAAVHYLQKVPKRDG
jgi:hypothetical protein